MLLTLDPGLDVTGWALFREDGLSPARAPHELAGALVEFDAYRTDPGMDLADRLAILAAGVRGHVLAAQHQEETPLRVLIERPAIAGTYARYKKRQYTDEGFTQKAMELCRFAIGALAATARSHGAHVEFVVASDLDKPTRRALVLRAFPQVSARTGADKIDALFYGLAALSDRRRRPRLPPRPDTVLIADRRSAPRPPDTRPADVVEILDQRRRPRPTEEP